MGAFQNQPLNHVEWHLIQRAIDGHSDSQNSLFGGYRTRLYRTAFAVLRNKEDAEDALQDGLCNAYIHLRSFQNRSSFVTWLTRIVMNSALMIRRRRNCRPAVSLNEILENGEGPLGREFADAGPNPEQLYRAAELDGLLSVEVDSLPAKLQTAFHLREVYGLSIAESSRKLGVGKGAFKSRLTRARRRLIESLHKPTNRASHARIFIGRRAVELKGLFDSDKSHPKPRFEYQRH